MVKNPPAMQEAQVRSLRQEDPLGKATATYSRILAWRMPWTEEPGGLQSRGSQRVRGTSTFSFFPVDKALGSQCRGSRVWSLIEELDPTSQLRTHMLQLENNHNKTQTVISLITEIAVSSIASKSFLIPQPLVLWSTWMNEWMNEWMRLN